MCGICGIAGEGAETARRVWEDFLDRQTSWSRPWSLYVLSEWARQYLHSGAPCRVAEGTAPAPTHGEVRR